MSGPEPGTWSRGRDRGDLRAARGIRPWPGFGHRARRRICRVWRPRPGRRGRRVRRAGGRSRVRRKRLGFSLRRNSHGLPLKSGLTPEGDSRLPPASFEGQVCRVSVLLLPAQKGRHQSQHRDVRCGYRSLRAGADAILQRSAGTWEPWPGEGAPTGSGQAARKERCQQRHKRFVSA
jgi:hypothetical protein